MIYEEIKKANIEAIKTKDSVARSIYSVILNKILLESIKLRESGKEIADADVSNILQKSVKELSEEKANYEKVNNESEAANIAKQISIVEKYLPKLLSENEIKAIILSLDDKSVPNVMKHFKANFNGTCDMRKVQEILRTFA